MIANISMVFPTKRFLFAIAGATLAISSASTTSLLANGFFFNSAAQAFATTDSGVNAAGGHTSVAGCSGNIAFFGYADCAAESTLSHSGGNRFGNTNTLVGDIAPQTQGQAFATGFSQSAYGNDGSASSTSSCIGGATYGKTATCNSSGWASKTSGSGARSSFFLY